MRVMEYKNRYGDVYTFEQLENGNIQWSGDFKWSRFGYPNDYAEAWKKFQEDYGGLSYEDFKQEVHAYDDKKGEYVFPELIKLIRSDSSHINMVDPSGGPYVTEGMDLGLLARELKGKVVQEFLSNEDGYEIVLKR